MTQQKVTLTSMQLSQGICRTLKVADSDLIYWNLVSPFFPKSNQDIREESHIC